MTRDAQYVTEPIAIVGSACRFPGNANTPEKLWGLLKKPRDVLREIPPDRFNVDKFYHPDAAHHGTSNVRHSYILSEDHRLFDAQFFGTKPVEAISIDPQQRMLLETVYEGLEAAGMPIEKLQGSNTGVYVGLMTNDYTDIVGRDIQKYPTYFASGTARSILSNRVSYFFDWHGPSMTIDTACSSSLIALHQAVQSLRNGECRVAVAAGTNLLLGPEQYVAESKLKMLSPTGRSKMWDRDADGYARGDGIAVVVVKSLAAALADGDHIECIIRESGINQDGHTKGITMPNPVAQAELIRSTYERAGLDLSRPSDRPQYFEAHGTGTPAGDPVEAEAISTAFFGEKAGYTRDLDGGPPLFVGSIKTVIGHTEGTAGLAAILKTSLALQNAKVPPNMLFNRLNPAILPFYNDLEIVTEAQEWPGLPSSTTRRASVNSFGFGGANAHAILESYNRTTSIGSCLINARHLVPFNFSANSSKSLFASLAAHSAYLNTEDGISLRDLAWTLNSRRSTLPIRISIAASDKEDLTKKLEAIVRSPPNSSPSAPNTISEQPKFLGVFTGQGAQWVQMGAELLDSCPLAIQCITNLDMALQAISESDRPDWLLKEEIMKDSLSSRIGEALFSQTICTAVQVMLVDLIQAAGIHFDTVVGHSSGEIAAAYAAGYISASDAIRIAYYRGLSLQYAQRDGGNRGIGAMMVAGTSFEDAHELCEMPTLKSRICIAASNSSDSITLSGDIDAVNEVIDIFEDEGKFSRLLKVDKAYHSHHMLPCATPYMENLKRSAISPCRISERRTTWISSVYALDITHVKDEISSTYWSNNMIKPVLYSQAISFATGAKGPFDMVLEIGPHPALKEPTLQTISEVSGQGVPYSATLIRGTSGTEAFASMLGAVWCALGSGVIDYQHFDSETTPGNSPPKLLKNLPTYQWDHDRVYWHESRSSAVFRTGAGKFHPLLGTKCPDGTTKEIRWRNYLYPREISWLAHHQVQGQMVFPAAGYITAATELIADQYGIDSIQMIDFQDVIIGQALTFEEGSGTEVIFAFTITSSQDNTITAVFNCYSESNRGTLSPVLHASAGALIMLGEVKHDSLPPVRKCTDSFLELEAKRFYDHVTEIGFGYTGPFVALSELTRRMDKATGIIAVPDEGNINPPFIIHPASLDGAIQSIMLAYSFPGDGRLNSLHLPTSIDHIRVDPSSFRSTAVPGSRLPFYSSVAEGKFSELSGDVEIYSPDSRSTILQLEGLHTTPLAPLSPATDTPLFTEITWAPERPSVYDLPSAPEPGSQDYNISLDLERVALFYLKQLAVQSESIPRISGKLHSLVSYAKHCVTQVESCEHLFAQSQWSNDTTKDIDTIAKGNAAVGNINFQALHKFAENIPSILCGKVDALEVLMEDHLPSQLYTGTFGFQFYLRQLGRIAGQISNRFPHINILELGSGTGQAANSVLSELGTAFSSYTYTSATDFLLDTARTEVSGDRTKLIFKVLEVEQDIIAQGFSENQYDLVIASLSLYPTRDVEATLFKIRRLIKPGGYLILLEVTNHNSMHVGLILGCLSGWFPNRTNEQNLSSCLSVERWRYFMDRTGFSNTDIVLQHPGHSPTPFSLMLTQAVDDRVNFLRDPLANSLHSFSSQSLTIIGGNSAQTATLIADIECMVTPYFGIVNISTSLTDLTQGYLTPMGTVLSLTELDEPTFVSMTPEKLRACQELFKQSKNIIWVGEGAQGSNPFSNMFVGIQRTLVTEMDHLRVQFLNLDSMVEAQGVEITKRLLQFMAGDQWDLMIQAKELLWYTEPELHLKKGRSFIPRLKLSHDRNERYNSGKRLIVKTVPRIESTISIVPSENGYQVFECGEDSSLFLPRGKVQVTSALLRPVEMGLNRYFFLIAGREVDGGNRVIGFSDSLKSCIGLPLSSMMRCGQSEKEALSWMLKVYINLLAQSAIRKVPPGKSLAVLDPDFSILAALKHYATQMNVQLALITSNDPSAPSPWIYIHPLSTRRVLHSSIPPQVTHFFDAELGRRTPSIILQALPKGCVIQTEASLTGGCSNRLSQANLDEVNVNFQSSWATAGEHDIPVNIKRFPIHDIKSLIEDEIKPNNQGIVSLDLPNLPIQVLPASKTVRFSKNKTYWLIGLTSGLGLSICEWMVRQGARYIALSSRNPTLDKNWIGSMACRGCTIRALPADVTDRNSIHESYQLITETMPPVGGVAQGAMVLEDTMFFDLDLPRFENVLRPKVQGTLLLDEIFKDNILDFMIFLSSMASITGNPGQVAYNAANMFMASLAAQRRQRGLATHAINLGAIVGNGYVTRELSIDQQSYLYRTGHNWMSEQDFHETFAEGVISCLHGARDADPCSSLRIDDDQSKKWYMNPMFQHLVSRRDPLIAGERTGKSGLALKTQLINSSSQFEAMEILQGAFAIKLQSALQTDPSKSVVYMSPDELGVDSLVAVDIRSWFLKELGLDIPVLKIFNAASIRELLEFSFAILPKSTGPNSLPEVSREAEQAYPGSNGRAERATGPVKEDEIDVTGATNTVDVINEDWAEHEKTFNIDYPSNGETESVSSSASIMTADLNSEKYGDSSSSSVQSDDNLPLGRKIQRSLPMSMAQAGFWFLTNFVQHKTAFNVTPVFELRGRFSIDRFTKAVRKVSQHHEALRTFFFVDSAQRPMQGVWDTPKLHLEHNNINHEIEAQVAANEMGTYTFDLAEGDVIRIKVLSLGLDRHWIIFGFHHIIMDGISFEIFSSDLETAYNGTALSPVVQYPDFAMQQLQYLEHGEYQVEPRYWKRQFPEVPAPIPLLPFSLRSDRPMVVGFSSHMAQLSLSTALAKDIERCCRKFRVTPFHFHLATWQIFLLRHLDLDKICVGLGDGNRTHPDVMQTVGLFLNTLPLQFENQPAQTFGQVVKHTKVVSQNAFANARIPFDAILDELKVHRSASYNPLFQTFFNFRQNLEVSRSFCGCTAQASLISPGDTSYDLQLDVSTSNNGDASVCLLVQKDLYGFDHAELLLRGYQRLLLEFCRNPARQVSWPKLYAADDIEQGMKLGKGPELRETWPATVIHRLDTMVSKYPQNVAIKESSGDELTYLKFQQRIAMISKKMLDSGVHQGARIAVLLSPTSDWICTIFAILRIGAIYIPLDRKLGLARLAYIVSDSNPLAVILDSTTASDIPGLKTEAQCIDITKLPIVTGDPPPNVAAPDQSAIIMYTSGSTGTPKGILIQHSAYIHHIQAFCAVWDIGEAKETILQQSSYAWDMSIYQVFVCACSGGILVVADSISRGDPFAISHIISSRGITITFATPTEYLTWLQHGRQNLRESRLKKAVSGGEFISASLTREFQSLNKKDLKLINVYGPAETTLSCSSAEVFYMEAYQRLQKPQFGLRTLPNYSIFVVDHNLNPVPLGIPGEVVVGGLGIARGYLDSNQTKERFFVDVHASPFFKSNDWTVVHRTGDRGMLTKQDGLILMGRISGDNQIKLGGIRINVEEIEKAILDISEGTISQAVISPRHAEPHSGDQELILVAFVVMNSVTENADGFLEALVQDLPLPPFMRPVAIIPVGSLPQNASCKVDRSAVNKLPLPNIVSSPRASVDPLPLETLLRQLWKEAIPGTVFSLYSVDSESDFFHVGGTSLSLVSLQSLINRHLGLLVALHRLFEASTLQGMARSLERLSSQSSYESVDWEAEVQHLVLGVTSDEGNDIDSGNSPAGTDVVVLTGATGFIGREILKQLLKSDTVHAVHCIAVRKPKDKLPTILQHPKVQMYHGDLGSPRLGLSVADAAMIFHIADIVIHNGADVSFMKTYQSLKLINVASTQELIKLVLPRKIPFHFVSSASVTRLASQEIFTEASVAQYPPPNHSDDGYTAMKWVSEVFLERISHQFNLDVFIHRPSSVMGDGAPDLDLMRNVIEYCQRTKVIPDLSSWSGTFDLISVESVGATIIEAVLVSGKDTSGANAGKVRYIHECGEVQLAPDEVRSFLEFRTGENFKEVSLGDWVECAEEAGMNTLVGLYLRKSPDGLALLPRLTKVGA